MKARTKKWLHAALVAATGALADIGAQLASGQLINAPRTVIVGLVIGACARIIGAVLAKIATTSLEDPRVGDG